MSKFLLLIAVPAAFVCGQATQCSLFNAPNSISPCINSVPSRQFGQPSLQSSLVSVSPNLVEGRELDRPQAIAFDTSGSTPILYVVDSVNNRVLGYNNLASLAVCGVGSPLSCGVANLVIGSQSPTSFQYTLPGGPGNPGSSNFGLNFPTSAAVDASGNLYVLDAGNNRILRYPAPFKQTSGLITTDLVIGQKNFNIGTSPNMGQSLPSNQSLYFFNGGTVLNSSLTIEPATGALWVTDPGNNRVLRFPVSQLAAGTSLPAADLVLGQTTFTTSSPFPTPPTTISQLNLNALFQPSGIAFDAKDRLFVSDGENGQFFRVLAWGSGFGIGAPASKVAGLSFQLNSQTQPPTLPNQYALGASPGLFTIGNNLWVCDAGYHRVVEYDIYDNWPTPPTNTTGGLNAQVSPAMIAVIGQGDLVSGKANQGLAQPSNSTVASPFGAAALGTDIWIADTGNNRVLDFPQQSGAKYSTASRVVGQLDFPYNSANLIEGREVNFTSVIGGGGGIAIDHKSNPPHLYIADTGNNRILCFNDARTVGADNTRPADLIIGQSGSTDDYHSLFNYPTNDPTTMSQAGLSLPTAVLVDPAGNLYVADLGNARVVRFPAPFAQPAGAQIQPNLVLGQPYFVGTPITEASPFTMAGPWGLAMFSDGSLAVSDFLLHRILIFKHASGADFTTGESASIVLGQQDFSGSTPSNSTSGLYAPHHIAVDTSDRLYVADTNNGRMVVFNGANTLGNGAGSAIQLTAFNQPQGIKVSSLTGEVWIADSNNRRLLRLPEYDKLIANPSTTTLTITNPQISLQTAPFAIELDNSDNVVVAEQANRIGFYYAQLAYQNPANYNSQPLAPGMLALLYRWGLSFNLTGTTAQLLPLPQSVGDLQVTVNGTTAPIYEIDPSAIAFQVPSNAPTSGTANIVVTHFSTGEIVGTVAASMAPSNPGFFTSNQSGQGLVVAGNNDTGVANSAANPIKAGGTNSHGGPNFLTLYLTGAGAFASSIQDGTVPSGGISTATPPTIIAADGCLGPCPASDVLYSGSSFYPGVWQINFKVESFFGPGPHVITVTMNGTPSNIGPSGQVASIQVYFYSN